MNWVELIAVVQVGAFYSLMATAYFLLCRTTGVLNFAVGAVAMVCGVVFASVSIAGWAVPAALGVALLASAAVAIGTEAFVVWPAAKKDRGEFASVLAVVALLFVIEQIVGIIFGRRALVAEPFLQGVVPVFDAQITQRDVLWIVSCVGAVVAAALWVRHGRYGRMLRAVGDNQFAALAVGIPVRRIRFIVAGMSGLLAGLGGVAVSSGAGVSFHSSLTYAIGGFIALIIGGMGSAWGPIVGGFLVAVLEVYGGLLFGSGSKDYLMLLALLATFAIRPQGLFALRVRTT